MSYIEISPFEKPMPTTSIAGDWQSAVIAHGAFASVISLNLDASNL